MEIQLSSLTGWSTPHLLECVAQHVTWQALLQILLTSCRYSYGYIPITSENLLVNEICCQWDSSMTYSHRIGEHKPAPMDSIKPHCSRYCKRNRESKNRKFQHINEIKSLRLSPPSVTSRGYIFICTKLVAIRSVKTRTRSSIHGVCKSPKIGLSCRKLSSPASY